MIQMKQGWISVAVLLAGLVPVAWAGDDEEPDVKEILKQADAATKALTELTYEGEFFGEGEIAARTPKVHGKVMARKAKRGLIGSMIGGGANLLRFEGKVQPPGMDEETAFESACDGKNIYALDREDKELIKGKYPDARPLLRAGTAILFQEFVHPTPFSDEINGKKATHEGIKKVGDVECDVIYVEYSMGLEARWFFGREDHLPRRVERIQMNDDGKMEGATVQTAKNLNTKPGLSDATFRLEAPEGFKTKEYEGNDQSGDSSVLAKGTNAPDWELKTPDGKTVSLKDQSGKVVVMVFWATYNGASRLALPEVQKLQEEYKDQPVTVWGVNCWERGGDPAAYLKKKGYSFGLLMEGDKVAEQYRINNQPAFYVIGPDGKIAYASIGFVKDKGKELSKAVAEALK